MNERDLWSLRLALTEFASASSTQSAAHIKPLHWHIAERLVIEGGFLPDDVTPRPPLRVDGRITGGRPLRLIFDPESAQQGERVVLGGLKTKNVDVVVATAAVGPCVAVSVKGTIKAFRNLTNRMEEAAGDCTNLHLAYPALVYGFLHVLRANRSEDVTAANDLAVDEHETPVNSIRRYHDALARLTGRSDIRNEVSRYEAVGLALVSPDNERDDRVLAEFPPLESPLNMRLFFQSIYSAYDQRFVYAAPALENQTQRRVWSEDSPAIEAARELSFVPRIA